jgi:chaperone modulatory protein CbpM
MKQEYIAVVLEDAPLSLEELAVSCTVSHEWIIQHVKAGVLLADPEPDPRHWLFTGRDLLRARRLRALERDFDANPELAGLVSDLFEELDRLRALLRREGLSPD